jgi:hypothetical protein
MGHASTGFLSSAARHFDICSNEIVSGATPPHKSRMRKNAGLDYSAHRSGGYRRVASASSRDSFDASIGAGICPIRKACHF